MATVQITSPLPLSSHGKPVDSFPHAAELERELKMTVHGEVRFDAGSRALYASDGSNYRQIPIGLVVPRNDQDVIATVAACKKFGAPILPRGAGTSLAGQSCNVAVVLDFTKYMNQILELDPERRFARVQPGVVLDTLRGKAEEFHLTFGPDPSTHSRCTLGGMIGNNSCGTHSLLAGKTVDNVIELRVLLSDGTIMTVGPELDERGIESIIAQGGRRGEIYTKLRALRDQYSGLVRDKYPDIPRRVSGYNLDELLPERGFNVAKALVGTEGTCVIVLEAKLRLIPSPQHRVLVGLGYADPFTAADHTPEILPFGPIGLEGFEGSIVDGLKAKGAPNLQLLPSGRGILLVEFGTDDPAESSRLAEALVAKLKTTPNPPNMRIYTAAESKLVWKIRESGARSAPVGPGIPRQWEGWDDAAVAPEKLGDYLRDIRKLLDEFHYTAQFYGHFGHGCIHMRVTFDFLSEPGIRAYAEFIERAADIVVKYGGSLSGEHGDGQARASLLPRMYGPELMKAFVEFKSAWDPENRMNPGKVVNAYLPTENLRLGADFHPAEPKTRFQFPDDGGSFAGAAGRCIGLGECRKQDSGAMCPSYMVTLEERHSTRGRAHMLFEALQGEVIKGVWDNEQVKEALDLCLSCKACKSECPTNVDIAAYRSEFLSHYYETKSRPLNAYAFGMIDRWAKLGSIAPGLANFFSQAPGFRQILQSLLHLAPQRRVPRLARSTFQQWARENKVPDIAGTISRPTPRDPQRGEVILWADTFNNYFLPATSQAALEVLQDAGFDVRVPQMHLCCGRPLYDFGFVDRAKNYLQEVMTVMAEPIDAGVPIVVLEPSCASVFRDELRNLFPKDERAARLRAQTFVLSEFLQQNAPGYEPPKLAEKILLHGHCHHKSVLKFGDEESLLKKMGAEVRAPDTGCCGMAGPFGFEKDKFQVSQAVGERILLPAVRKSPADTLVVSDGFSCREQIRFATGREPMHIAEVLRLALARQKKSQ